MTSFNDELRLVYDAFLAGELTYREYVARREHVAAVKRVELRLESLHRQVDAFR